MVSKSMAILYHFTDNENAASIIAGGFQDGVDGGVWFARHLDPWGERARSALLELRLDMTEGQLKAFEREVVADEEGGEGVDDFVKAADSEIESFLWHEIPAEIVNARGTVRLVPSDERSRLMIFGLDADE
jgi:hypothetical protein